LSDKVLIAHGRWGLAHATALPALLFSNTASPLLKFRLCRNRIAEGA